ncbi:MAG: hypothetical protein HC808_12295, partial [Candidatus Competibacteraceae bacterium]|nr:hypothetical protein [Candidatus Competibacteraceae bacterium]
MSTLTMSRVGLGWMIPVVKLVKGEDALQQLKIMGIAVGAPILAFAAFLLLWQISAAQVQTSLGTIPGPAGFWKQPAAWLTIISNNALERQRSSNGRNNATRKNWLKTP